MTKLKDIVAKSILSDKYWILESNGKKIGTIQAIDDGGFTLVKDEQRKKYATINALGAENNILFDKKKYHKKSVTVNLIGDYPISGNAYNVIWNIRKKFAAYTKTKKSKCHYCAGYFIVKFQNEWQIMFCPKLIMVNRYQISGPYKSKAEAENALKNGSY
jgi:hypothetical protein